MTNMHFERQAISSHQPRVSAVVRRTTLPLSNSFVNFSACHPVAPVLACAGVDLLSLDGLRAVRCLDSVAFPEVRRFLRVAKWVYKAGKGRATIHLDELKLKTKSHAENLLSNQSRLICSSTHDTNK